MPDDVLHGRFTDEELVDVADGAELDVPGELVPLEFKVRDETTAIIAAPRTSSSDTR